MKEIIKTFSAAILAIFTLAIAASAATPTLTNFNARHFTVQPFTTPTNVITLHLNPEQFDTNSTSITITNAGGGGTTNFFNTVFVTNNFYSSNIFVTNLTVLETTVTSNLFVTNIDASTVITTNLYVTNLFVTYEVVSNIVAGNISGTPPHLAMFWPDDFSVADSIVTQDTNTNNGIVVNGTGAGQIVLGGPTGVDGQSIDWGSDGTNTLFRAGHNLWYEAFDLTGPIYPGLGVTNATEHNSALYTSGGNLAAIYGTGGVSLNDALSSGREVRWFGNYFAPSQASRLGADELNTALPWEAVNQLTNMVWGYRNTVLADFSRLAVSHSGTNGSIVFDSQSSGSAGRPVRFDWDLGASNYMTLDISASEIPSLTLKYPTGSTSARLFITSLGGAILEAASGQTATLKDVVDGVSYQNSYFTPAQSDAVVNLGGTTGNRWNDVGMAGTAYVYGYRGSPITTFTRMAISSTGTNVWDTHRFDAQASGPNQSPRPFQFTNAPVMMPYITKAQKTALPAMNGMIVYQTDNTPGLRAYVNGAWVILTTAADP